MSAARDHREDAFELKDWLDPFHPVIAAAVDIWARGESEDWPFTYHTTLLHEAFGHDREAYIDSEKKAALEMLRDPHGVAQWIWDLTPENSKHHECVARLALKTRQQCGSFEGLLAEVKRHGRRAFVWVAAQAAQEVWHADPKLRARHGGDMLAFIQGFHARMWGKLEPKLFIGSHVNPNFDDEMRAYKAAQSE